MTEYELISLLRETASTISQDFEFFITATFAVIFVSYAVGDKLKKGPRIIISLLYLGSVVMILFRYQNLLDQILFIVANLNEMGSEFPATSNIPTVSILRRTLMVLGSIAAVYTVFRPLLGVNEEKMN